MPPIVFLLIEIACPNIPEYCSYKSRGLWSCISENLQYFRTFNGKCPESFTYTDWYSKIWEKQGKNKVYYAAIYSYSS